MLITLLCYDANVNQNTITVELENLFCEDKLFRIKLNTNSLQYIQLPD